MTTQRARCGAVAGAVAGAGAVAAVGGDLARQFESVEVADLQLLGLDRRGIDGVELFLEHGFEAPGLGADLFGQPGGAGVARAGQHLRGCQDD